MDYVERMCGPAALTASAATVYTSPAGYTTVLRNIRVVNESAATATFTISLGGDSAGHRLFYQQAVAPGDGFDWAGSIVVFPTEILQAYASTASVLTLIVCGVQIG